ncbi:MAG: endolytic transglycosylase MltG [Patescibacteria group bacterium]
MKKLTRYLILSGWIIFLTGIVVCLFNLKLIYHTFVIPNEKKLPVSWRKVIEKVTHRDLENKIVYQEEKTIKVLEGWNIREISQYFEREGLWPSDELLSLTGSPKYDYRQEKLADWPKDYSDRYDFLKDKPKYYSLEGFLFPDTYRVHASSTAEEAIFKMLDNFGKKLSPEMRKEIANQGRSLYQVVIMASILEKEAPFDSNDKENREARLISGIFWHRLKIGQALQSDATLSYWFGDKNSRHSGAQLEVNTPYNTYKYPGLPPTPICNPGLLALEAAVYPIDSDYNYFLTPSDSRQVIFSRSFEEHVANKLKYLK